MTCNGILQPKIVHEPKTDQIHQIVIILGFIHYPLNMLAPMDETFECFIIHLSKFISCIEILTALDTSVG